MLLFRKLNTTRKGAFMSLIEQRKFVAPEFVFGVDSRLSAGRYIKNLGARKVLLVSDPGVIKAGWARDIVETLAKENISHFIFSGISPNPRDHEVMAGVEVYLKAGCDSIIAVGGGSVMDAAKGIGIVVSNGGHVLDYEGVDQVPIPMPPLVCVPTTGGTSADVSQFCIISDSTRKVKIAIISKAVVPDVALVDPKCLLTMDAYLTACTGMDALVHAIEAFVSNAASPFTDLHALEAVRMIQAHLENSIKDLTDINARAGVMLASLEAGLAFSNASLGSVHALAHSLGGYLDLPHGECNALLLPHVVSFNFSSAEDRYLQLGTILGLEWKGLNAKQRESSLQKFLIDMRERLGIVGTLGSKGISTADVKELAGKAINDPCNATNPRTPSEEDLEVVLKESM